MCQVNKVPKGQEFMLTRYWGNYVVNAWVYFETIAHSFHIMVEELWE